VASSNIFSNLVNNNNDFYSGDDEGNEDDENDDESDSNAISSMPDLVPRDNDDRHGSDYDDNDIDLHVQQQPV
jgi:hypothetical protein